VTTKQYNVDSFVDVFGSLSPSFALRWTEVSI
jgi:hypothetical protein